MTGSKTLQTKITFYAGKKAGKKAIIETETGKSLTYCELLPAVNALKDYLGAKPKTIMVALPGGIADAVIWLAALTGGHLLIPVSPYLKEYEYSQIAGKHQPDLIINESTLTEIENIIHTRKKATSLPKPQEGKVCLATSGSTGAPKGVILSATQIVITADNIKKSHKITEEDRGLTSLPFYHVNAPVVSLITSMLSGSTLIIAPKYSTNRFWEWVKEYDPTWISLVPTMIAMLLSTGRPDFLDGASLRFIRTASEPLPAENLKRFEAKFNIPLIETYGLSEAASTVAANPVPPGKHKAGSVGLPLGVAIKICQAGTNRKLSTGETGEVCIKGENVIKNYEDNASSSSFDKGWFKTGDLGFIDEEGYLHLTGRAKDIIIRGGENISPREIEEVLLTYPGVREATVVGLPDPIYGEQVAAFVILQDTKDKQAVAKIKAYAGEKLIPQKVPAEIYLLDDLPRNKTGKVDKTALRNQANP